MTAEDAVRAHVRGMLEKLILHLRAKASDGSVHVQRKK
jgi:hypothetical protein